LAFSHCAYTIKVFNLSKMMSDRGHRVLHYGAAGAEAPGAELIETVSEDTWKECYSDRKETDFFHFDLGDKAYLEFNERTNAELKKRVRPWEDLVLCPWGLGHQAAVQDVPTFVVESGIGYPRTFAKFRVFESYAWLHTVLGSEGRWDGKAWYECVIPNYLDPEMFEFSAKKDDYFLYLGRLNPDKGVQIAVDVCREIGAKLVICGQGDPRPFLQSHVEYHPPVGVEERKSLLSRARALFCPTHYIGPFEGVNTEAQISGTPVICTDFGGFAESVLHGITGYRCRTHDQFVWAAEHVDEIDPADCREWALENYSMDRVAPMYEEYFTSVLDIRNKGWYERHPERKNLDWLKKHWVQSAFYPSHENPLPERSPWEKAQTWERDWWGDEDNSRWEGERRKQCEYARLMGLPDDLVLGDKSIVDIGAGPTSLLLRTISTGRKVAVDPMPMADWVWKRYRDEGVELVQMKGEELAPFYTFDEVWIYNCLQHTENPVKVLEAAKRSGKRIRVFEWLVQYTDTGHLHALTEKLFRDAFSSPAGEWKVSLWNTGTVNSLDGLMAGPYIAICMDKVS
jgi:glycosyltransferase involved in cell wall biosynthesis